MRVAAALTALSLTLSPAFAAGCSSDDETSATSTSPPDAVATVCEPIVDDDTRVVTIDVDDDSDGFGRYGLKTPTPLPAGAVRLVVNSVADNTDPIDVSVSSGGQVVFQFIRVAPGVLCAATLDLAAGDYVVTFGSSSKTFTVTE